MADIIAGVFPSRDQAEAAVRELRDHGYRAKDVSLVLHGPVTRAIGASQPAVPPTLRWVPALQAMTLAGIGETVVGGQIAECSRGQGAPEGTVSLADSLVCLGIQRDHATWYEQQVRQGYSLVTVRTDTDVADAQSILRQAGSIEVPSQARTPTDNQNVSTEYPAPEPEYQPGGPGFSGLPPQEHEPGVEIPMETPDDHVGP